MPEKNFFNDNFELVLSEPSDANTNSTTLLSDETDDRPKENMNQETGTSNQREYEVTFGNLLRSRYSFCCFSIFPLLCFHAAAKMCLFTLYEYDDDMLTCNAPRYLFKHRSCFQSNPSVAEPEQRGKMDGAPGSAVDIDQACKIFHSDQCFSCNN